MHTSHSNKPTILVTMGDPSGIGPEVLLKSLASQGVLRLANFLVIGDRFVMDRVKEDLRLRIDFPILDLANVSPKKFSYGKSRPDFGKASIEYLDEALEILKRKEADGLVTAPLNKASVIRSGRLNFEGHTEYLAKHTGTKDFAMMFVGKNLKVVLATRHIALKDVPKSITARLIYKAILLTYKCLKEDFKIPNPRIGVAGLNPHAGEDGLFGEEEKRTIIPAIRKASRFVRLLTGPVPPDVIFHQAINKRFDAVISMYHDQGLGPFKTLYFSSGVNSTLGLPFIRTSPDHGTAFDIAGKGVADPTSMIEAIRLACSISSNR